MKTKAAVAALCIGFIVLAFLDINSFVAGGRGGFELFYLNILPVLFPFFFITSVLTGIGFFSAKRPWMGVLGLSLLGGYPTSARMIAELYENGQMSKSQAHKTATFTSTASPIFTIATVGTMVGSIRFGVFLFIAMVVGSLLNGLLYKNIKAKNDLSLCRGDAPSPVSTFDIIANALQSAITSILSVGGLVVIFYIIGHQIDAVFNLSPVLDVILSGFLEMTAGIFRLDLATNSASVTLVAGAAILSFGGLCVAFQGFLFLRRTEMRFRFYLLYKTTHTILAVGVALLLLPLL